VEYTIDPILDPLIFKQITKKGAYNIIKLVENELNISYDFKFFMTTNLPNPHYLPEIVSKVVLINFTVTSKGLED
jgi:dynein heavy chain, axonemal